MHGITSVSNTNRLNTQISQVYLPTVVNGGNKIHPKYLVTKSNTRYFFFSFFKTFLKVWLHFYFYHRLFDLLSLYYHYFIISGGFRYSFGVCEKSTFELAGRGVNGTGRRYLFEGLNHNRTSSLWDNMDFWEFSFLDSVASEREAAGMDLNQLELINR